MIRYRQLSPTGDYTFGRSVTEFLVDTSAAVAQAIKTRLLLFQGEWVLDLSAGMPWFQEILGRHQQAAPAGPPGQNTYDVAVKSVIANTLGVSGILQYSSQFDGATRALTVEALVQTLFSATPVVIIQEIPGRTPFATSQLTSTPAFEPSGSGVFVLDQSVLDGSDVLA